VSAVVDAARRFAGPRRQRRIRWTVGAALLVSLAGGGYLLLHSSVSALQNLAVRLRLNPTSSLTRRDVVAAARAPIGRPLIEIAPGRLRAAIAAVPAVASVSVHRQWPHTVAINVVARRAAAVLLAPDGRYLADRTGVVFAPAGGSAAVARLARLRLDEPLHPAAAPVPTVRRAVSALASLPAPVRRTAGRLTWARATGLRFRYAGHPVLWGGRSGSRDKGAELAVAVRASAHDRVDLRTPGVLVTRPAGVSRADARRRPKGP
jgi:cell division protein FtsQ